MAGRDSIASTSLRSSFEVRTHQESDESKSNVNSRWFRTVFGLVLHLVGFTANALFLWAAEGANPIIFTILTLSWLTVGSVCAWVALKDDTVLPSLHSALRFPIVVVVYGFLQGMHIWNIGMGTLWLKNSSRAQQSFARGHSRGPSFSMKRVRSGRFDCPTRPVNSKSFEAVSESYVFAYTSILLFLLSAVPAANDAPWEKNVVDWRPYRWFLFGVAWLNLSAIAMGIMEIDFRVGKLLREQVNSSVLNSLFHFAFRLAEVSVRMIFIVVFNFTLILRWRCRPEFEGHEMQSWLKVVLAIFWHPFLIWVFHAQLLRHAVIPGAAKEPRLVHWALAWVVNITDPATFVDRAGYVAAARRFTGHLYTFRMLEMLTMITALLWFSAERFPEACLAEGEPPTVGGHLLWYHWGLLCLWVGILAVRVLTLFFFRGCCRLNSVDLVDDSVIQMKPAAHDREGSVRPLRPRGLSAMLLQVSTGLAFRLFYQEEKRFDDFIIESELGCGSYGVVAKVSCEDDFGNPMVFAMKLQNTFQMEEDASDLLCTLEESAGRERDILLQLEHPFVTRLLYYFKVPATQHYRYASTGEIVEDKRQSTVFHRAIIMEYLELGDLEQYVLAQALTARQRQLPRPRISPAPGELELQTMEQGVSFDNQLSRDSAAVIPGAGSPQLQTTEVEWLLLMRKFSAELLLVLEFVHNKDILYRDLKPSNLMLRANRWGRLHVVLGDFGLSKQIQPAVKAPKDEGGDEPEAAAGESFSTEEPVGSSSVGLYRPKFGKLDSLAGTMRYAAPEVLDIAHRKARRRYTPAVDLFSFGKTVLVILWRSKNSEKSRGLLMPEPPEYMKAVDMPPLAHELIWATTSRDPLKRGTANGQQRHPFFDGFRYGGAAFPKIDFKSLPVEATDL